MERIRLNATEIKYITLFESLTGAKVMDCVSEDNAIGFLIDKGYMGLAIGKNGMNIARVTKVIGKNVLVMEFLPDEKKSFIIMATFITEFLFNPFP